MKYYRYLLGIALLSVAAVPAFSQVLDDNEDEVVKMNAEQSVADYVPGQVLLKFKDEVRVKVSKARGQFASTSVEKVTSVLKKFDVRNMEKILPNEKPDRQLARSKAFNGEVIAEKDLSQLYCVTMAEEQSPKTLELVKELSKLDEVEFAEPNYRLHTLATIGDNAGTNPLAAQQWGLSKYGVKTLWTKPIVNARRPVIAIIDTGIDLTHPDLKDNLWTNTMEANGVEGYDNDNNGFVGDIHGYDFVNCSGKVRDNNMHGTHVAGIAAAANNDIGIVGANPQALIMGVTVMQSDGTGDVATIIKGIDYAVANGATVLNLSLGSYANSIAMRQSLEKAYQKAVIVAAAGNDGLHIYPYNCGTCRAMPMFPAAFSFVLGVMATQSNGDLACFTNYDCDGPNYSEITTYRDPDGFNYELSAPGVNILSTIPGGNYKELNGTSMATPLVAGAISALMMVKDYATQEMLWGDLLHSSNIAEAYNIKDRPAEFDMLRVQYKDREDAGPASGNDEDEYAADGEVDAGETIAVYPVVRTVFGPARNIKMHLEVGDYEDPSVVEILTDESNKVDFGTNLDAYGRGTALNPLKLKIPSTVADARKIKMKAVFSCDGVARYEGKFTMVVSNRKKISGLIDKDMTLTADHVWYVNDNLAIMKGATLTIEPGTRVEFAEGMGLSSRGKLIANGTPEKPIVFTRHLGEGAWNGIKSHRSDGQQVYGGYIYTNADSTLFTLVKTAQTPIRTEWNLSLPGIFYYNTEITKAPTMNFDLRDYLGEDGDDSYVDMTCRMDMLTDPNFLTPAVLQMLKDMRECYNKLLESPEYRTEWIHDQGWSSIKVSGRLFNWCTYDNPRDTISYCRIEEFRSEGGFYPYMKDCYLKPHDFSDNYYIFYNLVGLRNVVTGINGNNNVRNYSVYFDEYALRQLKHSNIVNNFLGNWSASSLPRYSWLNENNYFNNFKMEDQEGKYQGKLYSLAFDTEEATYDKSTTPSYLGSAREDVLRSYFYEIGNANSFGKIDLSNMRTEPVKEAHGIVWKVVVNGYDAQDQYNQLPPLGVGKHKFEVYFNRPMNKNVIPQISFGVRDPWTQNGVDEDGSWNAAGTVYTAYKTITGKTNSDGVNRIYVYGAEDNEFFECPYERDRFNINVQAAGSMATGFSAVPGMGKVSLNWNNCENNFDDAMGFNIYRYHEYMGEIPVLDEWGNKIVDHWDWDYDNQVSIPVYKMEPGLVCDTVRINDGIVDVTTTSWTDYDVAPKITYYYYYKVLSTDLKEYDVSNVVAVTPLTSTRGDANGSGLVDVNDVITTVNYAAGKNPKPFIFEAADMNADKLIDILDVIGIIQGILNPSLLTRAMDDVEAVYTIEDGIVYVDTPVELAGVQIQLTTEQGATVSVSDGLKGFEQTSAWLSDHDYLLMGYSMSGKTLASGKHAILNIGNAEIANVRLGDNMGNHVRAVNGNGDQTTGIDRMGRDVMNVKGVYNVKGQKIAGSNTQFEKLPKGVYIVDGRKVVK